MPQGSIRWFNKKKGYGFVIYEGQDIFVHHKEMDKNFLPEPNDIISFEVVNGEKGLKAKNITKVG